MPISVKNVLRYTTGKKERIFLHLMYVYMFDSLRVISEDVSRNDVA